MHFRIRRRVMVRRRWVPRRVRHHLLVRVAGAVIVLFAVTSLVSRVVAPALDAQRRWGATRTVIVARHRLEIGDVVDAGAVDTQSWPVALVAPGALDAAPIGHTVIATIEPGEALVSARLAPDGLHGVAALLPAGSTAIAIPIGPTVVALAVGDRVDLIAGFDAASASAGQAPAFVVARDALVVAVDEQRATVAVRDDDAARVAFAVVAGTVVPALRAT